MLLTKRTISSLYLVENSDMTNKHDTTALICATADGEPGVGEELLAAFYPESRTARVTFVHRMRTSGDGRETARAGGDESA